MTSQSPNTGAQTPEQSLSNVAKFWICALVLGIGIAATSAVFDRGNRSSLEQIVEKTSVGDTAFFALADREKVQLRFENAPLVFSNSTPDPMPDSRMIAAGETEGGKYKLYIPVERLSGNSEVGGPSWYIKVGLGQFIRVTR